MVPVCFAPICIRTTMPLLTTIEMQREQAVACENTSISPLEILTEPGEPKGCL